MSDQVYFIIGVLIVFGLFAFAMYRSIKKYDARMAETRKKKGRRK